MGINWINPDGSATPIHDSQDVADALSSDSDTAQEVAEQLNEEIRGK